MRLRLAAILVAAILPAAASGHAILVDSVPAPLGHVPAGHLAVVFRYNSRIDAGRSRLALIRPAGDTGRVTTQDGAAPDLLKADLDLTQGAYVLTWQVLAVDGHITRGRVPFTVDAPAAGVAPK